MSTQGALVGLVASIGLLLVASWCSARRRVSVLERIAPSRAGARQTRGPLSTLGVLVTRPRTGSGDRALATRLIQAGQARSPGDFRSEQLIWTLLGGGAGGAWGLALALGGSTWLGPVLLGSIGAVSGFIACDRRLSSQVRARQRRIDAQLPVAADLLAFAVTAGETPAAALDRVGTTMAGDLADEIEVVTSLQRSGAGLESSLRVLAERTGTPSMARFTEGLTISLERGTPVAEVLRAQAADARADQRRALMEQAGRKDVLMLLPVVFLILPTLVVIALFPGFTGLNLLVP